MSLPAPYQEHYYIGDGITVTFPFGSDFKALAEANVKCIIYFDDGTNCVPTFTVNMAAGSITIVTLTKPDGTVLTVPPVGSVVRVFRETPEQQNVTASQLQNYTAKQLEKIFDSIVAMIQENGYTAEHKTLRLTETQRDVSLQNMSEDEDQCLLYWDEESGTIKSTEYTQSGIKLEVERANDVADQAKSIAQTTQGSLTTHTSNINNPHLTSVTNLTDTNITSPVNGQFLMFDGLKWKNVFSSATVYWGQVLGNITNQTDLMNKFTEYVRTDGSSIMTNPLMMRATDDFKCAIAPYWDGVGFFKLNNNNSVTLIASLEYQDSFTPAENNVYNIGSTSKKWKNLYLAGKAYVATINNGADISVPTTSGTMALLSDIAIKSSEAEITSPINNQVLKYNGSKWVNETVQDLDNVISNCIVEIPQDIKVSYSGNTLTVKKGSKLYVPNGAGVFDTVVLDSDETYTASGTWSGMLFRRNAPGTSGYWGAQPAEINSGTPDASTNAVFYDTTNNRIDWYTSGGRADRLFSFPICKITVSNGVISDVRVLNGFGYIGAVAYALPGIKCLIPDGRNSDGTLNNVVHTTSAVSMLTTAYNATLLLHRVYGIQVPYFTNYADDKNFPTYYTNCEWYNPDTNEMYHVGSGAVSSRTYACVCCKTTASGGKITGLEIQYPFRAVNYNDFSDLKDAVKTNTTNIATLGTSKANTSLNNVSAGIDFVVESQEATALNDYTWYRKYKSGRVEQGGRASSVAYGGTPITFPVDMADTNYQIANNVLFDSTNGGMGSAGDKSTTGAKLRIYGYNLGTGAVSSGITLDCDWYVCGKAA